MNSIVPEINWLVGLAYFSLCITAEFLSMRDPTIHEKVAAVTQIAFGAVAAALVIPANANYTAGVLLVIVGSGRVMGRGIRASVEQIAINQEVRRYAATNGRRAKNQGMESRSTN